MKNIPLDDREILDLLNALVTLNAWIKRNQVRVPQLIGEWQPERLEALRKKLLAAFIGEVE